MDPSVLFVDPADEQFIEREASVNMTLKIEFVPLCTRSNDILFVYGLLTRYLRYCISDSVVEDGFDVFIPHDAVSADECAVEVRLPLNSTRVVVVSVQVNILQCMFWSEREDLWRTSGCVVSAQHLIHALVSSAWRLTAFVCCQPGPEYSDTHQHCRCDHLTSFSGFVVPANKLDIHDKSVTFAT